ncbi:F0F1 ATP synthase subunit delta [Mycoplasma parvum]|uniref:ATP synthase subunit delta n=1 Tax=Mycoplasma parvum str. Indiana TaxID=1403316 RepID=U5NCG6_9MOLU|nr:F0F1 ATP synthase subunit delta [Mycoplasma parvum]AGX89015.1 hypothetical protein PRV_01265 [Mycoplasma parvum str. Indiana]
MKNFSINDREKVLKFSVALMSCYSKEKDYRLLLDESRNLLSFLIQFPDFEVFLSSPRVDDKKKELFVKELIRLFSFKQKYLYSTIDLLFKSGLIRYLSLFLEKLISQLEWELEKVYIRIFSSKKLSIVQMRKLKKILELKFGKALKLETFIDPSLIAGIRLEHEDSVFDFSLAKKIDNMRKKVFSNSFY